MKTVIYKFNSYNVVKVTEDEVSLKDIKNDEDFMPLSLWNEGCESMGLPIIQIN